MQHRNSSFDNKCEFDQFECGHRDSAMNETVEAIRYHMQLISEKVMTCVNEMKEDRNMVFKLQNIFPFLQGEMSNRKIRKFKAIRNSNKKKKYEKVAKGPIIRNYKRIEEAKREIDSSFDNIIDLSEKIPKRNLRQFKIVFSSYLLNNKIVTWKAKLTKINGNVAIGICSLGKDIKTPLSQLDYQILFEKRCYLLENGQISLNCNNKEENNYFDITNPEFKQGDILYMLYHQKNEILKIYNKRIEVYLTKVVNIESSSRLYPCAVVKDVINNTIEFFDFKEHNTNSIFDDAIDTILLE